MPEANKDQGFTVVEVIVAIVAFGFVAAGMAQMLLGTIALQRNSNYLQTATTAAQSEVESLRNNNYNQLSNGSINFSAQLPSSLPSPKTGTAVISEPIPGIKRVDVTITYNNNGTNQSVELSSLIGVIGIST